MFGPRIAFSRLLSIGFHLFSLVLGSGGFYRLLRLPKTKKPRTKTKKKQKKPKDSEECLGQGLCSEALFFLFFLFFFGFPRVFLVLGSGGFYRLLRLPKTKKPRTKTKKKQKKQKNQRILRNVWAKDFVQRHWFFCFFWFSSSFFGFGLWKLLSATKTTKNSKTSKKRKKLKKPKKPKDSEECLGQGLCSEALFLYGFPRVFLVFGSTQKRKDCQECVGNTGFKEM